LRFRCAARKGKRLGRAGWERGEHDQQGKGSDELDLHNGDGLLLPKSPADVTSHLLEMPPHLILGWIERYLSLAKNPCAVAHVASLNSCNVQPLTSAARSAMSFT